MENKLRVGILTTFYCWDPAFSLTTVVGQQLQMLVKYGYKPVLFVLATFKDDDKVPAGVEIRKVIPQLILEPYANRDISKLGTDVELAKTAMEENMVDLDACLTHDIIFINSYLPYNIAMRKAIDGKLSKVKWLHWMHSGPSARPNLDGSVWDNLYTLPKNSRLVYMNHTDTVRAAEMYGIWPKDVRTIFNPMDVRELFDFHPLTRELIDAYDMMSSDIVISYPLSTTRMNDSGKQLSKVVWIASHLKKQGLSVRLIVPNAHANGESEKLAIEEMRRFADECGLGRNEFIFTSLFDAPEWEHGVPHEVVKDFFLLSNIFIFPSVSENCPLVLLEAMAGKNILILNKNFPAMKDFALEAAFYFEFGSLVESVNYHNGISNYLADVAKIIVSEYENNKVIKANTRLRQKFNIDTIFKRQLEPAILELVNQN